MNTTLHVQPLRGLPGGAPPANPPSDDDEEEYLTPQHPRVNPNVHATPTPATATPTSTPPSVNSTADTTPAAPTLADAPSIVGGVHVHT